MAIRMLCVVKCVPDYLDGASSVLDDRFCNAAQKETNESAVSVRADEDEISSVILRFLGDGRRRIPFDYLRCRLQVSPAQSFRHFLNQEPRRMSFAPHERLEIPDAVGEREQIDHGEHTHLSARRPGSCFDFAYDCFRQRRRINGQKYFHDLILQDC